MTVKINQPSITSSPKSNDMNKLSDGVHNELDELGGRLEASETMFLGLSKDPNKNLKGQLKKEGIKNKEVEKALEDFLALPNTAASFSKTGDLVGISLSCNGNREVAMIHVNSAAEIKADKFYGVLKQAIDAVKKDKSSEPPRIPREREYKE